MKIFKTILKHVGALSATVSVMLASISIFNFINLQPMDFLMIVLFLIFCLLYAIFLVHHENSWERD